MTCLLAPDIREYLMGILNILQPLNFFFECSLAATRKAAPFSCG
jgi:hypothetical protein